MERRIIRPEENVMVYHGTSLDCALGIARDGAILSPLEQLVMAFKRISKGNEEAFIRRFGHNFREYAEISERDKYGENEWDHRAKSVSVVIGIPDYRCAGHAEKKSLSGGLILGVEAHSNILRNLPKGLHLTYGDIAYIPDKLGISTLKEVILTEKAREFLVHIQKAFERYNPSYFLISRDFAIEPLHLVN